MRRQTRKSAQTCALCGNTGHNRRRCDFKPVSPIKKASKILPQKRAKSKNILSEEHKTFGLAVRVVAAAPQSPHIVNLKTNMEREQMVGALPVYRELRNHNQRSRTPVDFGKMVREANQKSDGGGQMLEMQKTPATLPKKRVQKTTLRKISYALAALGVVMIAPFPAIGYYQNLKMTSARAAEESTNAFQALKSATVSAMRVDILTAEKQLADALASFASADQLIKKDHKALLAVASHLPVIGQKIAAGQALLSAGEHLALGNAYMVRGADQAARAAPAPLTDRLEIMADHVTSARPQYEAALEALGGVSATSLPSEYQKPFQEFKFLLAAFVHDVASLPHLGEAARLMFGSDQLHRYLVLFQNQNELRPTGGFIGSIAIVDVQKGKILNMEVPGGGSYDLQGQLTEYLKPPTPLQLVNNRWEFQDANWFPDFPASAKKLAWFYQKSRGTSVDGVIAVNASVLERVLRVLGPVSAGAPGVTFNSSTALLALQAEVEVNYDKEKNTPKAVIGDLIDALTARLSTLDPAQAAALMSELEAALSQKEIQLSMNDVRIERTLREFGWTGEIAETEADQDYLAVVRANIRGGKSDARMEERIEHQAVIGDDGAVTDTVLIHRAHTGAPGEPFYGFPNVSYLRVYVPAGSELLDAGGFSYPPEDAFRVPESWYETDQDLATLEQETAVHAKTGTRITQEFGKTAFGNWVATPPGAGSDVYFRYRLPWRVRAATTAASSHPLIRLASAPGRASEHYTLVVQKQSGTKSAFSSSVIFPSPWVPVWKSDDRMTLAENGGRVEMPLLRDMAYGIVMERKH